MILDILNMIYYIQNKYKINNYNLINYNINIKHKYTAYKQYRILIIIICLNKKYFQNYLYIKAKNLTILNSLVRLLR